MIMEKDRICWTTIVNTLECYLVRSSYMLDRLTCSHVNLLREYDGHTGIAIWNLIREFYTGISYGKESQTVVLLL
jgi:hypothetical protein